MTFFFKIVTLLVVFTTFSSGQPSLPGPIAFDDVCRREQRMENLSCPQTDGVLQCLSLSQICDGVEDCNNGADEGRSLNSLNCK